MVENLTGMKKTKQEIATLLKARYPFLYISTYEETRVLDLLLETAREKAVINTKRDVFVYSITEGLIKHKSKNKTETVLTKDVIGALNFIVNYEAPALLVLKDVHNLFKGSNITFNQDMFIRKIRDVANSIKIDEYPKNVVIVAPSLELPSDLQKDITVVDFELPTLEEIREVLDGTIEDNSDVKISLNEEEKEQLCKAAQGLTLQEVGNAFARAIANRGQLTIEEIDIIMDEKCQVVKRSGILEFVKTDLSMDDVGGLENLKKWLKKRKNSWLGKAQKDYNLPAPKGLLITGVPGCGKSLTAKAVSAMWQLPLLRLDVGKIFNKWLGNSEENIREAIQTAEAISPSILWIDEIEKGFSGLDGEHDGGTSSRIFGTFLTWLNEKEKPVFVIATANNMHALPPEMLRKGRFDEIFFVDLPVINERKVIFKLHLQKRLKNSVSSDFIISEDLLNRLALQTEGFVGAEIEQVVISALYEAFAEDRKLKEDDLFKVIQNTVPLSTTQAEKIRTIRLWADERAVAATSHEDMNGYVPQEETQDEIEKKIEEKSKTEKVKHSRGGRTIDF